MAKPGKTLVLWNLVKGSFALFGSFDALTLFSPRNIPPSNNVADLFGMTLDVHPSKKLYCMYQVGAFQKAPSMQNIPTYPFTISTDGFAFPLIHCVVICMFQFPHLCK